MLLPQKRPSRLWTSICRGYARVLYRLQPLLRKLRLRRLWKLHVYALQKLQSAGFTPSVYGVWLNTNWTDGTFEFAVSGRFGFELFDFLKRSRNREFLFIDVGANFGTYSLIASTNPKCLRAIAIEPNPKVMEQLQNNVLANQASKVEALNFAIGMKEGRANLSVSDYHLGAANFRGKGQTLVEVIVRDGSLFDEIAARYPNTQVIVKIDVEGAEPEVVTALFSSQLAMSVVDVFLEVSPLWIPEQEIERMLLEMRTAGLTEKWRSYGIEQYDVHYSAN